MIPQVREPIPVAVRKSSPVLSGEFTAAVLAPAAESALQHPRSPGTGDWPSQARVSHRRLAQVEQADPRQAGDVRQARVGDVRAVQRETIQSLEPVSSLERGFARRPRAADGSVK